MKKNKKRLLALLTTASIALTGSSLTGCSNKNSNQPMIVQETTVHFGVGEHIISIPISPKNDIRRNNVQYDYHPGYEPIGISITAHGIYGNEFGGGAIIYVNTEEVDCSSDLIDKDGNYICIDFGTPIIYNKDENESNNGVKEFGIGEHIISVPINEDNRFEQFQYDYHNGYEVVGIATSAHGIHGNEFGGGVLLYKNINPVKCSRTDNGYTTFGMPVEKAKTLN